ncbi:MAG: transposase [Planctomycetia bacterium]|nr:transposase [Planctomycetia bacterium]
MAVMDMWKAFEKSTSENAFHAAILYDKFHVMRHLGKRWTKCGRWNMHGFQVKNVRISKVRNIRFYRTERTSPLMDASR